KVDFEMPLPFLLLHCKDQAEKLKTGEESTSKLSYEDRIKAENDHFDEPKSVYPNKRKRECIIQECNMPIKNPKRIDCCKMHTHLNSHRTEEIHNVSVTFRNVELICSLLGSW
ncbi:4761_t:CDS:2, partial [Funneliformis geosporum]